METFIPARSPLFAFTPCRDCAADGVGWTAGNGSTSDGMGGGGGRLSIAYNFTGIGMTYHFAQPIPDSWISRLFINGTAPPTPAKLANTTVSDLPLGAHRFTLDLFPPPSDPFAANTSTSAAQSSVMFMGATGQLGAMVTASTRNVTVDDTAWRSGIVSLSPGWNMLEGGSGGQSNWINGTQVDAERASAGQNFNESLSWTEMRGANTTVSFEGQAVWVYGLAGGEAGRYEVTLDNRTAGVFNASGGARAYNQVLFHVSSLPSGNHTLTLRNLDAGKRLSFDRLVALTGLSAATPRPVTPEPTASVPPMGTGPDESKKLSGGAVAGIIMGSVLAATLILAMILLMRRRRQRRADTDEYTSEKPGDNDKTFLKWPRQAKRPFFQLPEASATGPAGFLARVLPKRKSGTWSAASGNAETSFVPGIDSVRSTPTPQPTDERYTSFMKFSMSPRRERKHRPNISSPITMSETAAAQHRDGLAASGDAGETMTPAMAAVLAGRTISPLAQLRNGGDFGSAHDESYMPKMTTFGGMLAWSPKLAPRGGTEQKQRASVDTIGKILGQYGEGRESAIPPPQTHTQQDIGVTVSSPGDMHGWGHSRS